MELTIDLIKQLRDDGLSWRQIGLFLADKTGEDPYLLQERARHKWRTQNEIVEEKQSTVFRKSRKINKDNTNVSEIEVSDEEISLLDDVNLLKRHGFDPKYWKVIDSTCILRGGKWSSRVKAALRDVPLLDEEALSEAFLRVSENLPEPDVTESKYGERGPHIQTLAVIALYDLHYGRRGILGDHQKTAKDLQVVIEKIIKRFYHQPVDKIILPIGQDFLNADTIQGTTTKGTQQDNSLVWHEMLGGGLALAIWVVEALSAMAPVELIYNEGNHDKVLSYGIIKALEQRYRGSNQVTVDSDLHPRKYRTFESNLIGLTHGKEENNLPMVMQMEEPRLWGQSAHRYWILGHLHHLEMMEKNGVTILRCPSLAFNDEWTRSKMLVGADRAMACSIFNEEGLSDIWLIRP